MNTKEMLVHINDGGLDARFLKLYGGFATQTRERYSELVTRFATKFGDMEGVKLFSAPGRTEVGGNHTDHQNGRVLAAAVSLDAIAAVAPNGENVIRLQSKGFNMVEVNLEQLDMVAEEANTSRALVRGIAAKITDLGYTVKGFNAYTTTKVLQGSGLSSSAAFEVLVGAIINNLSCGNELTSLRIAQIAQYAENVYYGKPCGLMDQAACATGGFIAIDFKNKLTPEITPVSFDLTKHGYKLLIVNTRGSHGDLGDDYAAIPDEMGQVAQAFGKHLLREVSPSTFYDNVATLRDKVSDRAILRAMHFFWDNDRVLRQVDALQKGDITAFLSEVRKSGMSSMICLQNIYSAKNPCKQSITLALAMTDRFVTDKGACRVHGGGFAGTIQAYIPTDSVFDYIKAMNELFGDGCCFALTVRDVGVTVVEA